MVFKTVVLTLKAVLTSKTIVGELIVEMMQKAAEHPDQADKYNLQGQKYKRKQCNDHGKNTDYYLFEGEILTKHWFKDLFKSLI
jgi:hypothetical protein